MNIEILGVPFNGLGSPPDIENPAEGLRQANIVPLLESKGHNFRAQYYHMIDRCIQFLLHIANKDKRFK